MMTTEEVVVSSTLADLQSFGNGFVRDLRIDGKVGLAIAEYAQREGLHERLPDPLARYHWIHLQNGGTGREEFDQREAVAVLLDLERLLHRLFGLHDVFHVAQGDPLEISRRLQPGEQLADMNRQSLIVGAASPGRRGALLADQRGGRHLSAGHAVN